MSFLLEILGDVSRSYPFEGDIACIRALDTLISLVSDCPNIDSVFLRIVYAFHSPKQILLSVLNKRYNFISPLFLI